MSSLSELYQNVILEHNRSPRNFRPMTDADRKADGHNPLCGDQVTVWVKLEGDVIGDVSFQGAGCAISKASASLMTGAVKGKRREEADALFDRFHRLVTGTLPAGESETLGKLAVFSGVSQFPIRVKCASLSWHTLKAALEGGSPPDRPIA
ncbi:MAG: SUF system NifU family Fe-S cluster assembly protein [Gemmatimonadota bacterium]|nr:SUF system NifU family Fe-S cluster assembly protein [Gemmatimonadales bacterium]MDQ3138275.1 SUF system NifU family Fe-S cluster assembly protein [Gemmatimonadota bacterium]